MDRKKVNPVKVILYAILSFILLIVIVLLGYVIYLDSNYYRIEDFARMTIENNSSSKVSFDQTYSISTYNIGFGAYSDDYTFFMDTGEMQDGTKTVGEYGTARSKEECQENTNGSVELLKSLNSDFYFVQEVDQSSTRSYRINQVEALKTNFEDYGSVFTVNFHSGYLLYPFNNPHGEVNGGTVTLSKYHLDSSIRRSLPISEDFITRFFDLDRCLTINYLPIENSSKQLVLINLHLSAYDEGGVFRAKQMELLNNILQEERDKGNYVIAGGDFNHDIADSSTYFKTEQKIPSWLAFLDDDSLSEGYRFADTNNNAPTCRGADMVYIKDVTYTCIVDGFIVSDNINIEQVYNVDNQFLYSDHNPCYMEFSLN